MARSITPTLRAAIDTPGSYFMITKLEISPSRVFFKTLMDDYPPSTGADPLGIQNDPMRQDIEYCTSGSYLATFFCDGHLKYMKEGSTAVTDMGYDSSVKPGVLGSKLFLYNSGVVTRYNINWGTPITLTSGSALASVSNVGVVHAVSDDECVVLAVDEGGYRPYYISGVSPIQSSRRFMFPTLMISSGSGRSLEEMALFSGAAKLDNKIFVYISNVANGYVEGMYYDLDTATWSDVFTALPTDLDVSQCEFKIANVYNHNDTLYMCGQFNRLDNLSTATVYSLVLSSTDGRTFSLDRHTLVSNIGYRFLARVADNKLFLANCNRVCYDNVTWVFDGQSEVEGEMVTIPGTHVKTVSYQGSGSCTVTLKTGTEQYFDHPCIQEGSRMRVFTGMKTSAGDEYVLQGTYILDAVKNARGNGRRGNQIQGTTEALWKLSGLAMPFYAELLGKSVYFDPMIDSDTTEMTAATFASRTVSQFQIDMWQQEPYTNSNRGITGVDMIDRGGVNFNTSGSSGAHRFGIIHKNEIQNISLMDDNPLLTSGSIIAKIYGWSHPATESDTHSDCVSLILVTEDDAGNETYHFSADNSSGSGYWRFDWPFTNLPGKDIGSPVQVEVHNLTAGHRIKKAGIVFDAIDGTWFNISRVEFISGTEASYTYEDADTPWEKQADGTFKVPHAGRPFIMYGQRPYHTSNFILAAAFNNTYTSGSCVPNYPVACGLVGLAEDGANYTLARFNRTNGKVELILCRNGIERELTPGVTPSWTIHDDHTIRFDHNCGHFDVYILNDSGVFQKVLQYDWKASDGYMFTSPTATMKCGIYGNVSTPSVRTLGLYAGMSESVSNADGLGIDPLGDITDFPERGKLKLGDDAFTYEGKIPHPTYCRGPYQLRQYGVYAPPWGSGNYGLECRDFDWAASTSLLNGKLISVNSGCNFICSGALWQIWTSTGGVMEPRRNRARYYSDNQQIGKAYHSLANKVWVTGGFSGIQQANPTEKVMHHMEGDMAYYEIEGSLKCYWYMGAGGNDDTTVEDLISQVCALSGARSNFPGDLTSGSIAISAPTTLISTPYADGLDISFETDYNISYLMSANIKIDSTNYESGSGFQNDNHYILACEKTSGSAIFRYTVTSGSSGHLMYSCDHDVSTGTQKFRVLYHLNNLSIYQNGQWVATVAFDKLIYGDNLTISMDGNLTIRNLRIKELSDWREAVYIDLETDGRSALGSIIQQRVVEVVPKSDGSLDFYYEIDRATVGGVRDPREHDYIKSVPMDGASDAIVQGWFEVKTLQNSDFAERLGLATKLFRMPDLTSGAYRAAMLSLKKTYESYRKHTFVIRPDMALETGDLYPLEYTAYGTGAIVSCLVIVEDTSTEISMSGSKLISRMTVQGRQKP
jgi:hypothetical protein